MIFLKVKRTVKCLYASPEFASYRGAEKPLHTANLGTTCHKIKPAVTEQLKVKMFVFIFHPNIKFIKEKK